MTTSAAPTETTEDPSDAERTAWPIAGRLLDAITRRDFVALAQCLDPDVRMRALVPPGQVELNGAADAVARFERWFGGEDAYELVDAAIGQVGPRPYLRWRIRLGSPEAATGSRVVEQHVFADGVGRIETLDLLCSGFHAEAAGPVRSGGSR